jgi:hypothetical protein
MAFDILQAYSKGIPSSSEISLAVRSFIMFTYFAMAAAVTG